MTQSCCPHPSQLLNYFKWERPASGSPPFSNVWLTLSHKQQKHASVGRRVKWPSEQTEDCQTEAQVVTLSWGWHLVRPKPPTLPAIPLAPGRKFHKVSVTTTKALPSNMLPWIMTGGFYSLIVLEQDIFFDHQRGCEKLPPFQAMTPESLLRSKLNWKPVRCCFLPQTQRTISGEWGSCDQNDSRWKTNASLPPTQFH